MVEGRGLRRLVASTNNVEEALAISRPLLGPSAIERLDRKALFRWRSTIVDLGSVAIAVQEYGAGFVATAEEGPSNLVSVSLPLSTVSGQATIGSTTQAMARGRSTYVYSAPERSAFCFGTNYRGLQMTVRVSELDSVLGALLGSTVKTSIRFDPFMSLERGVGAAIDRAIAFASAESAREDGLVSTPPAAQRFGEALLVKLIHGQPNNYSERLAKIQRAADPRSVRVAAEYLKANLARSVRIAELAAVTGVSGRALQLGFQKHHGCTPLEFLREARLTFARSLVLDVGRGLSIAEIASQSGFSHLGRFGGHYRARFGELPTKTRARAR